MNDHPIESLETELQNILMERAMSVLSVPSFTGEQRIQAQISVSHMAEQLAAFVREKQDEAVALAKDYVREITRCEGPSATEWGKGYDSCAQRVRLMMNDFRLLHAEPQRCEIVCPPLIVMRQDEPSPPWPMCCELPAEHEGPHQDDGTRWDVRDDGERKALWIEWQEATGG